MELANKNLNSNCVSMEHLLKHMNLEDVVLKLGASGENFNRNDDKDLKYSLNKKNDQDDEDRVDYSSDEDM